MGWISVVFVHKVIDAATVNVDAGVARRQVLFRSIGVDPEAPVDPKRMISDVEFFGLLERVAAGNDEGRSIPVRIGASMRCDDYGAFGLAFKSAPDLLGSYRRVERFGKVVTSIANFRVLPGNGTVRMEVIPGPDLCYGLTMTNELAVAAATALSREVAQGDFAPAAVHFTHAAPNDTSVQQAHFRCPVHYGSDRDALEVSLAAATKPNRLGDAGIAAFFDAHLDEELKGIEDPSGLSRRVLDQIGDALSEGVPTLAQVGARLGISGRTLQRRLAEVDLAYQDLVSEARRTLAKQFLRQTDYALAEIAFLTGFSDQSTFTRAFKRWTGQTPASYRREG
ncbi:MAG: AraC family transcriptional regulator ligand-binding domain-containing protein [Rhodobacter sp.]|nr:AraC family transcriptional regulator ligand-binding domain-containing protein [Rhodobacter sp.]